MIKKLFYLAIFALFIYSLVLLAAPYYHYYAFKSDLEELLKVSIADRPDEVMTKILDLAKQYKIPIEKNDINLNLADEYTAKISWQETVVFFPAYQIYKTIVSFDIDTSKL